MTRSRARKLWRALTFAPWLPIVAYLGFVGIVALASQQHSILPDSLTDTLPWWLALAWTVAIAVGGACATIGGLWLHTRIESVGLAFLGSGAVIYGACVTIAAWPSGATVLAVVVAIASMCAIRMRTLSLARRAQDEARQIARDR